ncbi:MAG: glycosyltransferase family 1 protein [bacterium]
MARPLRIVTTGLAATYPLGGVFWDYLQYPLGFQRLGHEVLYLEDTGRWCYDAAAQTFVEAGAANARHLACEIARLEPALADRWFFRDATGATFGRDWNDVTRFVREADLFLHISASCWMRDEYWASAVVAFVDSDPMYTQASVPAYVAGTADQGERQRVDMLKRHHVHFTFGENVGRPGSTVPTALFDWIPTRQPMVLDCFTPASRPLAARRRVLTTVASWEPHAKPLVVDGVRYFGKSSEFERFLALPSRSAVPIEVALSGPAPRERLREAGFVLIDPASVSGDGWRYRDYLADSLGEWSVAKHAYAASRSGWFSCRSSCYLALGVPVIVQDTGFGHAIPTGEGVLPFSTLDEAADAIARVAREPERHSAAALAIARSHFDSNLVLGQLLAHALGARAIRGTAS